MKQCCLEPSRKVALQSSDAKVNSSSPGATRAFAQGSQGSGAQLVVCASFFPEVPCTNVLCSVGVISVYSLSQPCRKWNQRNQRASQRLGRGNFVHEHLLWCAKEVTGRELQQLSRPWPLLECGPSLSPQWQGPAGLPRSVPPLRWSHSAGGSSLRCMLRPLPDEGCRTGVRLSVCVFMWSCGSAVSAQTQLVNKCDWASLCGKSQLWPLVAGDGIAWSVVKGIPIKCNPGK